MWLVHATFAAMNEHVRPATDRRTTQAAEGLPRWRWTTAELQRLAEFGAFTAEQGFELIGGEIVPMSPAGRRHEVVREWLERAMRRLEPCDAWVVAEPQLNLAEDVYTKPDIVVRPASIPTPDLGGADVLLVIEVAESSLQYDLGAKAHLYAGHGVRDYWVVDARTLATRVHRDPGPEGYASIAEVTAHEHLAAMLVPALTLRLADLELPD